ncbi:MAG: hypothetical protein Q8O84_04040, partial [Nanoarchaeota archaeon]|nr:hypothetical protein [Nanoarchaeota archaeon]
PLSKLTWKIVKNIREEYKKENITYEKLAQKYNTDCGTIGRIIHNQAWKDENYVCENESFIKNGENHHNSFLNKEIVNEIRSEYGSGKYSQTDLAKKYNLNTKHINKILLNQTWKDEEYKVEIFDFKKGENSCKAKLNWQIVNEIRRIYNEEDVSCEKLAKEYDIHSTTVFNIVNNQRWKDSNYKNTKKFNFGKAKLNWEQVREIRHKYHNENIPIKELAEYYSVSYSTINGIINNKTWIEDTN